MVNITMDGVLLTMTMEIEIESMVIAIYISVEDKVQISRQCNDDLLLQIVM